MGFPTSAKLRLEARYRSAFLLATGHVDRHTSVSGRIEAFGTHGRGSALAEAASEDGWAATVAGRHAIGDHVVLIAELLLVDARWPARIRAGFAAEQRSTTAQTALRLTDLPFSRLMSPAMTARTAGSGSV